METFFFFFFSQIKHTVELACFLLFSHCYNGDGANGKTVSHHWNKRGQTEHEVLQSGEGTEEVLLQDQLR